MTKKEYKKIKSLMYDVKKRQDKLINKENLMRIINLRFYDKKNFMNIRNLSICVEDLLKILIILGKSSDKEAK